MIIYIMHFFNIVFKMGITASIAAVIVMVVRLFLKKAPKIFSLMLWFAVFFRLLCPFAIQSSYGLPNPLSNNIDYATNTQTPVTIPILPIIEEEYRNTANVSSITAPNTVLTVSNNSFSTPLNILVYIWFFGFIALVLYGFISYMLMKPFVLGFIRPRIYIPVWLAGDELEYILKHEQTHIKRYDYLFKPIAFLAVALHWFNPIVWISYILMSRDMELSADENVMKQAAYDIRKSYSSSLVRLSSVESDLFIPLAFGKTGVKSRVKNILNYKKPAFWVSAVSLIIVVGIGGFLLTNYKTKDIDHILAWTNSLSVDNVQSIEMVKSPSDRDNQYKKFSSEEFEPIVKIINASKGQKTNTPDELGSTIVLYITTKDGIVHTFQNLRNTYLVIDNVYLSADSSWLENSFKSFKGDSPLPDGFFERVTGITTTYSLTKLGKNGGVLDSLSPLDGSYKQLAESIVSSYMLKSTISPARDINSFDKYYMLRVTYSKNNSNETHDYYIFSIDGGTYIQNGKDGPCTNIDIELYNHVDALF